MKSKSSIQDIIHLKMMQTITDRIRRVDEIDKQNDRITKRIQQQEGTISFIKNASDYNKYSQHLRYSQKNRISNNQYQNNLTSHALIDKDQKNSNTNYLKRTNTCEQLFDDESDVHGNHMIPRINNMVETLNPTLFLRIRPQTSSLTQRQNKTQGEGQGLGIKNKGENKIGLQNTEECEQRRYIDKLAGAIFPQQASESLEKNVEKLNKGSVEKIYEMEKQIQQTTFIIEIIKTLNQIIIRGRVSQEDLKKRYFIKTLETTYFLKILLSFMSEQQQLFLFECILQKDGTLSSETLPNDNKQPNKDKLNIPDGDNRISKESIKDDLLKKFIHDLDIVNERIIIKSQNPNQKSKQLHSSNPSQAGSKLNFRFQKNRNEILKEETLQTYLAGNFRNLTTCQCNNLNESPPKKRQSLQKESQNRNNSIENKLDVPMSIQQDAIVKVEEIESIAAIKSPRFSKKLKKRVQSYDQLNEEEISKQNEQIDKSLNFFKNSKLSQYFNLYTEPDEDVENKNRQREIPQNPSSKLNNEESDKVNAKASHQRNNLYSYDLNHTQPIHSAISQKIITKQSLSRVQFHSKLNQSEASQNIDLSKSGYYQQTIDSSKLANTESNNQVKRQISGSQKVKLFITLLNKQKVKAKHYDKDQDKSDKDKMNNLLMKKNLSSQGQLLQNFLVSKQQINQDIENQQNRIKSPTKINLTKNGATIRNILSAKQRTEGV